MKYGRYFVVRTDSMLRGNGVCVVGTELADRIM